MAFRQLGGGRFCLWLLVLSALLQLGQPRTREDPLEDDSAPAIEEMRRRLKNEVRGHRQGVLLVTSPKDEQIAKLTIPIWRAYCEQHTLGFFVQQDVLNTHLIPEWSKVRSLMELLPATRWKYVLLVDARSLPVGFNMTLSSSVKRHMRHKRFKNDDAKVRRIFCPQDCEEEYKDAISDGKCYGPILSGCIFQASKKETTGLVKEWYANRRVDDTEEVREIGKAWSRMKDSSWSEVFLHDFQEDIGKKTSSFIAQFTFDTKYRWNIRDQVYDFILAHPELAKIGNMTFEGARSDRRRNTTFERTGQEEL